MLVEVDQELIPVCRLVAAPNLRRIEADQIERLHGQAVPTVRQRFRIAERAVDSRDPPRLALDVSRRPDMAGRVADADTHGVAGLEAGLHQAVLFLATSVKRETSNVKRQAPGHCPSVDV